ncbi:MAG: chromosomal replication initiator protein DnaA [Bacteroidota bacterium]
MNLLNAWTHAQTALQQKVGDSCYQSWFSHLHPLSSTENSLILTTPDEFFKSWIEEHYLAIIQDILTNQTQTSVTVTICVSNTTIIPVPTPEKASPTNIVHHQVAKKIPGSRFNPRLNFDNFVVGSSNQMACGASQAVANAPARAYNPLFLYGQSGLGKTHLMQAIAQHVVQHNPSLQCVYMTSEQFTNELIESIHHKTATQFKQKYRNVDVLLIDDIQFIAGKRSTQEEFFHTFNAMHDNHKQIVITSDRPPKEISDLEERLVTRFLWGLIVDIQPPDFETRVAILRKKIELENVAVPDDVVYFIAEQIKTNIRELEGALIRVVAGSILQEKPINLNLAHMILKNMLHETTKIISIEMVQQMVCEHFKINQNELKNNKRTKNFVLPRQIAMYLIRTLTNHSLPEIGKSFGGKDHTTVLYACKKIEENMDHNSEIKYIIEKLSTILKQ